MTCYGGSCAIGLCADSKALIETLLSIVESSEVETTIGSLVKAGKGCYLCDVVAKIPSRGRARDAVTRGENKLTQVQAGKASTK